MSNFRTKDEVEENARKSHSIAEMCRNFGIVASGGNYKVMHNLIDKYHIDISHFTGQGWNVGLKFKPNPPKALSEILIENSYYQSYKLKQRLIDEHLKEHKCEKCGNDRWYGQPIPLELHHINGNHNDNRLENLQLLCPNCHAQTDNYRGRNGKRYDLKEVIPIQPRVITNTKIEIIKEEKPKRLLRDVLIRTCGPTYLMVVFSFDYTNGYSKIINYITEKYDLEYRYKEVNTINGTDDFIFYVK